MALKINFKTDKRIFTVNEVAKLVTQQLDKMSYMPIKFIGIRDSENGPYLLFSFGKKLFREVKVTKEAKGIGICLEEVKKAA